ncbi:MAG: D-alanyl-D-alanine carboxypeptidase, partial [Eubacterium sp.]|nr:D-alanyl-D-alanine carboxypeptidase [Eubacterium sp.]
SVSASSYMVMSGSTSEKVVSKHADRKMQPGKITMLMTAMVVLDNMYDEKELKNTVETGNTIAEYGGTFKEGESASVGDLLNAMLVGGDVQSAELLAKYSASSREIFVNEMNSKCMELGLMDTYFTNAGGRYDIAAYSTASDLAVITQAAYRYQVVKDALARKSVTIAVVDKKKKKPREIEFLGTDPLLTGNEKTDYQYIKGGILGLVDETVNSAQFAAIATKDDMQMIVVLMDSAKENTAREATSLFEYADAKVTKNTIVKKGKLAGRARVRGGAVTRVAGYTETKGFAYVPPEGSDSLIQTQVAMYDDLNAPLKKGDKVGEFRIYVADELKGTVDLITKENVSEGWFLSRYYISNTATIVIGVVLFLLLVFLLRVGHVKRRRAKRREAIRRQKIREIARKQLEIDEDRKRREWDATGYEAMPPRTTDIRKEAIDKGVKRRGRRSQRKK